MGPATGGTSGQQAHIASCEIVLLLFFPLASDRSMRLVASDKCEVRGAAFAGPSMRDLLFRHRDECLSVIVCTLKRFLVPGVNVNSLLRVAFPSPAVGFNWTFLVPVHHPSIDRSLQSVLDPCCLAIFLLAPGS